MTVEGRSKAGSEAVRLNSNLTSPVWSMARTHHELRRFVQVEARIVTRIQMKRIFHLLQFHFNTILIVLIKSEYLGLKSTL